MRTEVKLGIMICLLLAGIAVIWVAVTGGGDDQQTDQVAQDDGNAPPMSPPPGGVQAEPNTVPRGWIGREPNVAPPVPATSGDDETDDDGGVLPSGSVGDPGAIKPPTIDDRGALPNAPRTLTQQDPNETQIQPPSPNTGQSVPTRDPNTTRTRTYTVTAEDTGGFWGIAQRVYGDGKYMNLIAEANPTANPNALNVDDRLLIPPLPTQTSGTGPAPAPGEARTRADGTREYIVKENDSFWTIAQQAYGNGAYYPLLVQANPDVNPSNLRVGSRILIPPRQATTRSSQPTTGRAGGDSVSAGAGQMVYTVTAEDGRGYWGIAEKLYGDGTYYVLLQRANPDTSSSALRVGQAILAPTRAAAQRMMSAGTTTPQEEDTTTPPPVAPSEGPVFD